MGGGSAVQRGSGRRYLNVRDPDSGATPLLAAVLAERNAEEMVELLLRCPEIDVNIPNYDLVTPLLAAVELGYTNIVRRLLQHPRIDRNQLNREGKSPLDLALEAENWEIAEMLFD
jgi:ankyrin repeat protein